MSAPTPESLHAELATRMRTVIMPCAAIAPGGAPASVLSSYLGGHPYLPDGASWPQHPDGTMVFVAQVNFAELPPPPGFPGRGLLQWFVLGDDTYGLTFDDTQGAAGFEVRWYDEPYASCGVTPTSPTPDADDDDVYSPIDAGPTAIAFQPGWCAPSWDELPAAFRADPFWGVFARAHGEAPDDAEFAYAEYARGDESVLVQGSKIGGFASYTQADPHGFAAFPPLGAPAGRLLVELDASQTGGWGDVGIGHLFGDPTALAAGALQTVRYHWDCG